MEIIEEFNDIASNDSPESLEEFEIESIRLEGFIAITFPKAFSDFGFCKFLFQLSSSPFTKPTEI